MSGIAVRVMSLAVAVSASETAETGRFHLGSLDGLVPGLDSLAVGCLESGNLLYFHFGNGDVEVLFFGLAGLHFTFALALGGIGLAAFGLAFAALFRLGFAALGVGFAAFSLWLAAFGLRLGSAGFHRGHAFHSAAFQDNQDMTGFAGHDESNILAFHFERFRGDGGRIQIRVVINVDGYDLVLGTRNQGCDFRIFLAGCHGCRKNKACGTKH